MCDVKGPRTVVVSCAILNTVGAWVKYVSGERREKEKEKEGEGKKRKGSKFSHCTNHTTITHNNTNNTNNNITITIKRGEFLDFIGRTNVMCYGSTSLSSCPSKNCC